jgi:hypothetical protein
LALSPRQEILYVHKIDIWEPVEEIDGATGEPRTGYYQRATDVPCYFVIRGSVETPNNAGLRVEGDNAFTRDDIHVDATLQIDSDWVVKNVTLHADGTQSETYGRFWVISGQPLSVSRAGNRRAEHRKLQAVQVHAPPEGVS